MQVDTMPRQTGWDIADIFHTDLFSAANSNNLSPSSSFSFNSPSSRESTPNHLPTPPQQSPYPAFPPSSGPAVADPTSESFFAFLDSGDDSKADPYTAFMNGGPSASSSNSASSGMGLDFGFDFSSIPLMMTSPMPPGPDAQGPPQARSNPMDFSGMNLEMLMSMGGVEAMEMGIDPQLVDSPAPLVSMAEDEDEAEHQEEEEEEAAPTKTTTRSRKEPVSGVTRSSKRGRAVSATKSTPPPTASTSTPLPQQQRNQEEQQDRLTLTIAPVKVGGRGGGRRGTVQSGGISKKGAVTVNGALGIGNVAVYGGSVLMEDKDKENVGLADKGRAKGKKAAAEALPSPPSSHHDGEEEGEEEPAPRPSTSTATSGGSILTGNALVAQGRKVTPFDLGIEGLSLSASFAIPPGTFNLTTPSAVGSSSGLGVNALIGAANGGPAYTKAPPAHHREASVDGDGDGDEIPADWRPTPEMLAKMTSKEKRQLRNKISARNFRVRRKEYISTLELDIAERDRLLDAIRSELGTSMSENVALRQEIEALKRTLLDGRGSSASWTMNVDNKLEGLNLPPPAPLPEKSAAEMLQQQRQQAVTSNLLKPNTQKDISNGSNAKFWGGVGSLGGVLPVHTAFVPSVASGFANMGGVGIGAGPGLQENMNPLMRGRPQEQRVEEERAQEARRREEEERKESFDGFADVNMFTMKNMDAYRMHLWGKMAAQYHLHQQQQQNLFQQQQQQQAQSHSQHYQPQLSGLAANLRPSYFTSVSAGALSGKAAASSSESRVPLGNTTNSSGVNGVYTPLLAAFLNGKQMSLFGKQPPAITSKHHDEKEKKLVQERHEQEQQARAAMLAAVASQTILKKMGQAFWDAFSGGSSLSPSSHHSNWDADKVRRVLEGSAVVKIVDVEPKVNKVKEEEKEGVVVVGLGLKRGGNVSARGSVSTPASPVLRNSVPSLATTASSTTSELAPVKKCGVFGRAINARREAAVVEKGVCDVLEERMKSLALGSKEGE